MRLTDLEGKKVVIWGAGREAMAFVHALQATGVNVHTSIVAEGAEPDQFVEGMEVEPLSVETLRRADFVFRSPGVSVYRPELQGLSVITATSLWFGESHAPIIAVTGTKGKSTTSSLIAHILENIGVDVRLAGNIGRAPSGLRRFARTRNVGRRAIELPTGRRRH